MIGLYIVLGLVSGVAALVGWIYLHEFAHALAGKWLLGAKSIIYPFPHMHNGKFYFGRTEWLSFTKTPTREKMIKISYAPRFVDFIGMVLLLTFFTFVPHIIWTFPIFVLLFGSVVDMFTGSLGIAVNTDIRKYSDDSTIRLWFCRITQMGMVVVCVVASVGWLF